VADAIGAHLKTNGGCDQRLDHILAIQVLVDWRSFWWMRLKARAYPFNSKF